jgi:hypothetical protein
MLARALYFEEVISDFLRTGRDSRNAKWSKLQLTQPEWHMVKILIVILYPFYTASLNLQTTSRPRIDRVFWTYEVLFNKIDRLQEFLDVVNKGKWSEEPWAPNLGISLKAMGTKLSKYYSKTSAPFVYSDAMILDPTVKVELFQRRSREGDRDYAQEYSDSFRDRVLQYRKAPSDP